MFRPLRLSIANASDSGNEITVSVIKPVAGIHVQHLHPKIFTRRKTIFLCLKSQDLLHPFGIYSVKTQESGSEVIQYGLLISKANNGEYILLDGCPCPIDFEKCDAKYEKYENNERLGEYSTRPQTAQEYMESWHMERSETEKHAIPKSSFSMKPPLASSSSDTAISKRYTLSPQNEKDPLDFIFSRYFNTLYSLTTPLSYFPKTAISRLKNMCANDYAMVLECLSKVHLSSASLNSRREARYGLFNRGEIVQGNAQIHMSRFELESQALFTGKYHSELLKEDLAQGLILALKIREAHLQIIVVLESIIYMKIEEDEFLNSGIVKKKDRKSSRTSLVRRKKKNLIPTFLGVGVSDETESPAVSPSESHMSPSSLYSSLTTFIDQIALWDSLLENGKMDKDQNTLGFLSFVIAPYYGKSLPKIVQWIFKLFKSHRPKIPRPILTKNKSIDSSVNAEDTPAEPVLPLYSEWTKSTSALDNAPKIKELKAGKRSRFSKTLMNPDKIPLLKRAATAIDPAPEEPAFLLKRSKSNLGTKNLKKRQVDMSVTKPDQAEVDAKRSTSFLFGDARKIKSASTLSEHDCLQVQATPAKPVQRTRGMATTMATTKTETTTQVFATPSHKRTSDMNFVIKETPQVAQKSISIHEKLANAARNISEHASIITSSPVKDFQGHDLFSNDRYEQAKISSPIKAITSSPAEFTSKPGQPISLMQSPFYNNSLAGSPPPAKVSVNKLSHVNKKSVVEPAKSVRNTKKTTKITKPIPTKKPNPVAKEDVDEPVVSDKSIWDIFDIVDEHEDFKKSTKKENLKEIKDRGETQTEKIRHTTTPAISSVIAVNVDSDSDSDYERLLAAVEKPVPKKYVKKRGR